MGGSFIGGRPIGVSPMVSATAAEAARRAGGAPFVGGAVKGRKGKAQQRRAAEPDAEAAALARAVQEAIDECVQSGALPGVQYPAPRVAAPSAKQSKALPPTTRWVWLPAR